MESFISDFESIVLVAAVVVVRLVHSPSLSTLLLYSVTERIGENDFNTKRLHNKTSGTKHIIMSYNVLSLLKHP